MMEKKPLKKSELIAELAATAQVTQAVAAKMLESLAEIAYNEARHGFTIPGICKIKVMRKKARRRRNPMTGESLLVGEHDAVKIQPLKRAKDRIAPRPPDLIKKASAPQDTPRPQDSPPVQAPPDTVSDDRIDPLPPGERVAQEPLRHSEDDLVFSCPDCGETMVVSRQAVTDRTPCSSCGIELDLVSFVRDAAPTTETPAEPQGEFVFFICQTCGQEIEAPVDLVGLEADCPACGSSISISAQEPAQTIVTDAADAPAGGDEEMSNKDMRSMTIRIDLSDLA